MAGLTVLVVDDERDLADLYSMWIQDDYETLIAYGGREAIEAMSEEVDVVLLDRRMPDVTGDEVLDRIRSENYECRIVMITAVDPGLDVVEMEFDKYLTKPVSRPQIQRVVENMRVQLRRDGQLREHASLSNRMEAVEDEVDPEDLEDSEEYRELQERLQELGDTLTDGLEDAADGGDGAASDAGDGATGVPDADDDGDESGESDLGEELEF